jgi:hypothetical protein
VRLCVLLAEEELARLRAPQDHALHLGRHACERGSVALASDLGSDLGRCSIFKARQGGPSDRAFQSEGGVDSIRVKIPRLL